MILPIALHKVGNKSNMEGYFLSDALLTQDESLSNLLNGYFVSSFKFDTLYQFFHESNINLNEIYTYANAILDAPEALLTQSIAMAKYLYECSDHPKIKSGELYVVYYDAFDFKGGTYPAVGIFKSEQKDIFLKVKALNNNFEIDQHEGVNLAKLDKGAIVIKDEEGNLQVAVVDNSNKNAEAQYWIDDFLKVQQLQNEYYHTNQAMSMYKEFVMQDLPQNFEVSKADQADLLNRSMTYFKENDTFELQAFEQEVLAQPEIIDRFVQYKESYENQYEVQIENQFDISDAALKKQARSYKSVIKLDKNFHIYIHGDRSRIEQGVDEEGRKYYIIYYDQEV